MVRRIILKNGIDPLVHNLRDGRLGILNNDPAPYLAPQAVVLDISLPDGSGVDVLKFIRQHNLKLSVVVLTSNPYDALRTKCQSLGAAVVLDKLEGLDQVRRALLALSPHSKVN
jgi:DNA-binding NarL/FixJ family response regulator